MSLILSEKVPLAILRKRVKILVIDDDPNSFPKDQLIDEGYNIQHWEKVRSLNRLLDGEFDVIILDIGGVTDDPNPDAGLSVLEHIKKHNPHQIVVAFSGQTFDLSKTGFWRMADDSICKPVYAVKCKEVLDQLLEAKFSMEHLWGELEAILLSKNINQREIDKLKYNLSVAIGAKDAEKARLALPATINGVKLGIEALSTVNKILTLWGIG